MNSTHLLFISLASKELYMLQIVESSFLAVANLTVLGELKSTIRGPKAESQFGANDLFWGHEQN